MIKFFRKIRQRMLSENKFSKYLLYALGEIVLVVIGILIALQLNIKNEERKAHERNIELLNKLSQEAKLNVGRVDTLLSYSFPLFYDHADSIRNILNHGFKASDLNYILSKDIWYYNAFNLNKTTFEQIKNTGALYTLGTDSLITEIELYYQLCERESQYNEIYSKDVVTDRSRCAHGWTYLEMEMRVDPENAIKLGSWLYDTESEDYRNFKLFISKVCYHSYFMTGKLKRIRAESEKLIVSVKDELKQME